MAEDKKPSRSQESKSLKMLQKSIENNPDGKAMRAELKKQGKSRKEIAAQFAKIAMIQKKSIDETEAYRQKDRKDQAKRDEANAHRMQEIMKEKQEQGIDKKTAEELAAVLVDVEERSFQKQEDKREKRIEREKTFTGRLVNKAFSKIPKMLGGDKEKQIEEKRERKGFFNSLKAMFSKKDKEAGSGIFGFMSKIFSKIKGVFKLISLKFLLIGALVVGMIANLNMEQIKEIWKNLKEAFKAIYEFLEPIVKWLWKVVTENVLPNLVGFFIDSLKTITQTFKNIKERFEGFGEMTLEEKVKAVFDAIGDLGKGFVNLGANLVKAVMKMFGADEKAIANVDKFTKPIKDFFGEMFTALGQLFTGDWRGSLKTAWDALFGAKEGELGGIVGFIWNKVVKPIFNWVKDLAWSMAKEIPGVEKALAWLGIGKKPKTKEEINAAIAKEKAEKEKKARIARGEDSYGNVKEHISFNKMAGKTRLNEEKLNKLSMSQMKEMRDYMLSSGKFKGEEAIEMNKVFDKLIKKKAVEDEKNAKIDSAQQAKRDAGKFGTEDEFYKSAEGKAFMKTYKDEKTFKRTGKIGVTSSKAKERAFNAYQKMGHVGVMDSSYSELDTIKRHEGFKPGVYKDSVRNKKNPQGIDTIGYGFNLERGGAQEILDKFDIKKSVADLRSGKVNLTEEEASRLVQGEMGHFKKVAEDFVGEETWKKLSPDRQGILTNMAYNMGAGGIGQFNNLRTALQEGNFKEAQIQMMKSKWAKDVKGRAVELTARMGGDAKSQALGTAQSGYTAATSQGGQPIYVTNNTIDSSKTVNSGGGTTLNVQNASSKLGSEKQGDLKSGA